MTDRYDLAIPPDHAPADPTVQRITTLHNRWCEEGPPPAGVSMRHWWGLRLAELEAALRSAATEERNLAHALGGDRTAKTIAHTLTVHGHTLDAVRTMTYAELLAVPGIGGPSLARIREALDGCPEPDGMDQAKPEEQPLTVPRGTATALHEVLGQLLGEEGAQAIGRVRALHHDWESDPGHCAHCTGPDGNLVRFPCPTIRTLNGPPVAS